MKNFRNFAVGLGMVVFTHSASHSSSSGHYENVSVSSGPVSGISLGDTTTFKGIPYAAPPVGELRWKLPQVPKPWSEPLHAYSYGSLCLQPDANLVLVKGTQGSEDCLTLNIWRPNSNSGSLPVMFFIHGGGNFLGASNQNVLGRNVYDGSYLAAHGNAVIVTINYRLGPLGFFGHPKLSRESAYGGSGNYGIYDQLQALRWVQANIANFGGDPARVTLFGESAGAIDSLVLIASPLAKGLFSQAIIQSGFLTEVSQSAGEKLGIDLETSLGCGQSSDTLACMRTKSAEEIVRTQIPNSGGQFATRNAIIDGQLLKKPVLETLLSGNFNHIPVIIGTTADEMTVLGPVFGNLPLTQSDLVKTVDAKWGEEKGSQILSLYPTPSVDYPFPVDAYEALVGDYFAQCPARRIARALEANGVPVWKYVFTHTSDDPYLKPWKAGHTFELPYVFHTLSVVSSFREFDLADEISHYWTSFANHQDPNASGAPAWPTNAGMEDRYLQLNVTTSAQKQYHAALCDFWD